MDHETAARRGGAHGVDRRHGSDLVNYKPRRERHPRGQSGRMDEHAEGEARKPNTVLREQRDIGTCPRAVVRRG
eukprot:2029798-Prymnesium_polylepis.1